MHHAYAERPLYTGMAWDRHPHHHGHDLDGFCHSCCHPRSKCCCHRQCRKESKELLVQPTQDRGTTGTDVQFGKIVQRSAFFPAMSTMFDTQSGNRKVEEAAVNIPIKPGVQIGTGKAFIGGGCCVHLSVEYAPSSPTVQSIVVVLVDDSESTVLAWGKLEQPGVGYQVKEGIITTKPGAELTVMVANATARVRWCEVFSC